MNRKPQQHLINILKSTRDHHPNFVIFLGAGASVTSGVMTARHMIAKWREIYFDMYGGEYKSMSDFLADSSWSGSDEEYSLLFEKLYDQPSQRREFIESCLKDSSPSWGYIYLVNLIRNKFFNTIFTTNFDDLLNEACYQFSNDARPIVCSHDSSIDSIRITTQRPKIIKLHGDFLFDNIKNTVRELETLENNTQEKFKQYANEFGFIVIGYSGCDRSIMDTLNTLLRFDNYFPHGIYWCVRKGSSVNSKVDLLSRFPKFHLIEIDGFDEFFADLHKSMDLKLQPEMSNPYKALSDRLNDLLNKINIPEYNIHPVIENDIANLGEAIAKIGGNKNMTKNNVPIPYSLLAEIKARENNYEKALEYKLREIEINPNKDYELFEMAFKYLSKLKHEKYDDKLFELMETSELAISEDINLIFQFAVDLMNGGKLKLSKKVLDFSFNLSEKYSLDYDMNLHKINLFLIKRLNGEKLSKVEISDLNRIHKNTNDDDIKMGVNILLEKYDEAETYLNSKKYLGYMKGWSILKLLKPHIKNEKTLEKLNSEDEVKLMEMINEKGLIEKLFEGNEKKK